MDSLFMPARPYGKYDAAYHINANICEGCAVRNSRSAIQHHGSAKAVVYLCAASKDDQEVTLCDDGRIQCKDCGNANAMSANSERRDHKRTFLKMISEHTPF